MGWFDSRKKYTLPPFAVNAFGKLPFYKEYLYICPDQAFADLKSWVDDRFERLSRQGTEPPYLAPDRHFLIHMPHHKVDLVGSIWESDDGLRTFPFMLATAVPRKARKYGFPLFWQCLNNLWDYFERFGQHLRETGSSTDFYKGIRGVEHQLPKILEPTWPDLKKRDNDGRQRLADGAFAKYHFGQNTHSSEQWFANLDLPDLPNLILWPQSNHAEVPYEAVGYVSMLGMEALALDLFLPVAEKTAVREPDAEPARGNDQTLDDVKIQAAIQSRDTAFVNATAMAAAMDARLQEGKTSEEATLILGSKENPTESEVGTLPVSSTQQGGDPAWEKTQDLELSVLQGAMAEKGEHQDAVSEIHAEQSTMPLNAEDLETLLADESEFINTQPLPKMEAPPETLEPHRKESHSTCDGEGEELLFTQESISIDREGVNLLEDLVGSDELETDVNNGQREEAPPARRRVKDSDHDTP